MGDDCFHGGGLKGAGLQGQNNGADTKGKKCVTCLRSELDIGFEGRESGESSF